jgi:hypothetical protein
MGIGSSNSTYNVNSSIANANICHPLHVQNLTLALQVSKALKVACGVVVKPRSDIRPYLSCSIEDGPVSLISNLITLHYYPFDLSEIVFVPSAHKYSRFLVELRL